MIITGTVRDAVAIGSLQQSRGAIIFGKGVRIPTVPTKADVYFATYAELQKLADGMPEPYGLLVWIMRGTGIRIGEALAVKCESFRGDGTLRITEQFTTARTYAPLKHRSAGQSRDVPFPDYVLKMLPEDKGYIFPECNRTTLDRHFRKARDNAGLPKSFTWHSLRHIFVSVALSEGVPITDVSRWLGHHSINTTSSIYGHMVPGAVPRARSILDQEYEKWRGEESA
jgi:integrase